MNGPFCPKIFALLHYFCVDQDNQRFWRFTTFSWAKSTKGQMLVAKLNLRLGYQNNPIQFSFIGPHDLIGTLGKQSNQNIK